MTKSPGRRGTGHPIIVGLYGAGGFAREVKPILMETLARRSAELPLVYFVETEPRVREVNGLQVLSEDEFFSLPCEERLFNVAIGDAHVRERLSAVCMARGARPIAIRAANATVYDGNEIGEGAILCANTVVTSNARIGRFFHSNLGSYVAHDCVIGDFVTFGPNVHCNGRVHVGDHAYVGAGAILKPGTPSSPLVIGEGAVVGMGAVVTKDVAPRTTVVGNPARVLEKKVVPRGNLWVGPGGDRRVPAVAVRGKPRLARSDVQFDADRPKLHS